MIYKCSILGGAKLQKICICTKSTGKINSSACHFLDSDRQNVATGAVVSQGHNRPKGSFGAL